MARWTEKHTQMRSKKLHSAQMLAMGSLYAASTHQDSPPPEIVAPGANTELPAIRRPRGRPKGKKTDRSKKKKEKDTTSERYEQRVTVTHCDKKEYPYFAIPNAARRTLWEALEAKRSGMKAGIPDLCFPVPLQGKGGLYVEMKKREGGIVSPMQKYWIIILKACNYRMEVARGSTEAIAIIDDYFDGWAGFPDDIKQMLSRILASEYERKQRLSRLREMQQAV